MTDQTQATPAAAAPATPAAAADPTATPPADPTPAAATPSIIPEAPAAAETPPAATPPVEEGPEWMLAPDMKGVGKMPTWFKADKYKTVADQAEAYADLERRLGAFVGAPKDGKYEVPALPEGVSGSFDAEHPMVKTFTSWATENQLSQKAYGELLGMVASYEAAQMPTSAEVQAEVGPDASKRISEVALWAKANLTGDEYSLFRTAMGDRNAATVFKAFEAVLAKVRQPAVPKPGQGDGSVPPSELDAINELQAKVGPDGKRLYETDPKHREMVERRRMAYFQAQAGG